MLIWTPLKSSKGSLGPLKGHTRRPKIAYFHTLCLFSEKLFSNFFSYYTYSFYMMRSISCEKVDPLESFKGAFEGPPGAPKIEKNTIFAHFDEFLKNCSATFLLITHTASISCQLSPMLIWTPLKNSKGPLEPLKGPSCRPKIHIFRTLCQFSQKLFSNFFSYYTYSFYMMRSISYEKVDPLESFEGAL